MIEIQSPKPLLEKTRFGTFFAKDIHPDPVLLQVNRSIVPASPAEIAAEKLVEFIATKQIERDSLRVESPFFPGLQLKKTGTIQRVERENARPWENIVDYFTRRYRVEQASFKVLKSELDMTPITIRRNLLRLGIPPLKSFEYKDPNARATAASWENPESRSRRSRSLKKSWREKRDDLIAVLHSPAIEDSKRKKRVIFDKENPDVALRRTEMARKTAREAQEQKVRGVFGDDPDEALRVLLVERSLGFKAAAIELGEKISGYTIAHEALRRGIRRPYRQGTRQSKLADAKLFMAQKDLWEKLPERQREALDFILDEKGRVRRNEEIAKIMRISRAAAGELLVRAKANLEKLKRGEAVYGKGQLERTISRI